MIANAMHEKLILYGIRYRPNYKIEIAESFPESLGEHLRPQLILAIKNRLLLSKSSSQPKSTQSLPISNRNLDSSEQILWRLLSDRTK